MGLFVWLTVKWVIYIYIYIYIYAQTYARHLLCAGAKKVCMYRSLCVSLSLSLFVYVYIHIHVYVYT